MAMSSWLNLSFKMSLNIRIITSVFVWLISSYRLYLTNLTQIYRSGRSVILQTFKMYTQQSKQSDWYSDLVLLHVDITYQGQYHCLAISELWMSQGQPEQVDVKTWTSFFLFNEKCDDYLKTKTNKYSEVHLEKNLFSHRTCSICCLQMKVKAKIKYTEAVSLFSKIIASTYFFVYDQRTELNPDWLFNNSHLLAELITKFVPKIFF